MEPYMDLTEKTTILFPKALYKGLKRVAKARHTSVGRLVREACSQQYGLGLAEDAMAAADQLAELALPVASVATMKAESVPQPDDLLL